MNEDIQRAKKRRKKSFNNYFQLIIVSCMNFCAFYRKYEHLFFFTIYEVIYVCVGECAAANFCWKQANQSKKKGFQKEERIQMGNE